MTDFNLAEAEKLANDYDNPADFLDMRDTLCSAIAHIRKLEPLVNQIWEGHRALRERIGDNMTHPLSGELRKLADYETIFTKSENAYTAALRRAADALDSSERSISGHVAMGKLLTAERDSLKAQLDEARIAEALTRAQLEVFSKDELIMAAHKERERYREALEWYANPNRPWDHTIAEKALREHDK